MIVPRAHRIGIRRAPNVSMRDCTADRPARRRARADARLGTGTLVGRTVDHLADRLEPQLDRVPGRRRDVVELGHQRRRDRCSWTAASPRRSSAPSTPSSTACWASLADRAAEAGAGHQRCPVVDLQRVAGRSHGFRRVRTARVTSVAPMPLPGPVRHCARSSCSGSHSGRSRRARGAARRTTRHLPWPEQTRACAASPSRKPVRASEPARGRAAR